MKAEDFMNGPSSLNTDSEQVPGGVTNDNTDALSPEVQAKFDEFVASNEGQSWTQRLVEGGIEAFMEATPKDENGLAVVPTSFFKEVMQNALMSIILLSMNPKVTDEELDEVTTLLENAADALAVGNERSTELLVEALDGVDKLRNKYAEAG